MSLKFLLNGTSVSSNVSSKVAMKNLTPQDFAITMTTMEAAVEASLL
mgnify:CR=1 FL=1